jgi:Uma2 family endonuclease
MSTALRPPMHRDAFLAGENRQELRYGFDGFAPVVIFEILGPATATTDRIVRNRECRARPSVQRYVLLEQIRPAATVFAREDTDWVDRIVDADAVLALPELGIDLPLAEPYEGIAFPDPPEDD